MYHRATLEVHAVKFMLLYYQFLINMCSRFTSVWLAVAQKDGLILKSTKTSTTAIKNWSPSVLYQQYIEMLLI